MTRHIALPKNKSFLLLALLLCLPAVSPAYEGDPITNAITDLKYMQSAPSRVLEDPGGDAYLAGGLLGVGLFLYSEDRQGVKLIRVNRTAGLDKAANTAEKVGNGAYELALLGVFAGTGYVFKNDKLKDTAFIAAESFLAANAVGTVVKYAVGRARPYTGDGKLAFKPFSFNNTHLSFPSGHTTSAFSVASVFAMQYESPVVGILAYGAAAATGLQRIYSNNHWPTDVFAGAVLGTVTGRLAVNRARRKAAGKEDLTFYPFVSPQASTLGLGMKLAF